jgi:hypothetical protein
MIPSYAHCEPLSLSDPAYQQTVDLVRTHYPRACIAMIDRYRNPVLEEAFEAKRARLAAAGVGQELRLFHGTKRHAVPHICEQGFQPSAGKVMAYGFGIYFAKHFSMSWGFSDSVETMNDPMSYVFVCRVLPGNLCFGRANLLPSDGFHSSGNSGSLETSTIFAIPSADQMIPEFLIRFHKNSERDYTPAPPTEADMLARSSKELERQYKTALRKISRKEAKAKTSSPS